MAEFLDKLKGRIDKGISTVNTKSKEIIGRQKIRLHLSELSAERKLLLQELGKLAYSCYQPPDRLDLGAGAASEGNPEGGSAINGVWESAVVAALKRISGGGSKDALLEDTAGRFSLTAGALYIETGKLLPESEKKGRIMRLGRVIGKLGLASKKESRIADGVRETVYVFDRRAIDSLPEYTAGTAGTPDMPGTASSMIAKCRKIREIDSGIAKLEKELEKIAEGNR